MERSCLMTNLSMSYCYQKVKTRMETVEEGRREEEEEEKKEEEEEEDLLNGISWPPRCYTCNFCKREFRSAQALGGHMNVHRRDRALLRQYSPPTPIPTPIPTPTPTPTPTHDNNNIGQYTNLNLNLQHNPNPNPNWSSNSFPASSFPETKKSVTLAPVHDDFRHECDPFDLKVSDFKKSVEIAKPPYNLFEFERGRKVESFADSGDWNKQRDQKIVRLNLMEISSVITDDSNRVKDIDLELRLGYS